jgi:hypothetical protein
MNADHCEHRDDGDAGSASLWALSMAMVLWVCVSGVVLAGVAVVARHRAATAADMAALAAASVIAQSESAGESASESAGDGDGGSKACAAANAIALANDATVTSCHVTGQIVDVTTNVRVPALDPLRSLGLDSVSARARAGPG